MQGIGRHANLKLSIEPKLPPRSRETDLYLLGAILTLRFLFRSWIGINRGLNQNLAREIVNENSPCRRLRFGRPQQLQRNLIGLCGILLGGDQLPGQGATTVVDEPPLTRIFHRTRVPFPDQTFLFIDFRLVVILLFQLGPGEALEAAHAVDKDDLSANLTQTRNRRRVDPHRLARLDLITECIEKRSTIIPPRTFLHHRHHDALAGLLLQKFLARCDHFFELGLLIDHAMIDMKLVLDVLATNIEETDPGTQLILEFPGLSFRKAK